MKEESIRKFILPPGPILSILLIGLLLLSVLLYYRAITIQRFFEPALAMTQPRIKFSNNINNLLLKEFGKEEIKGIKFKTGSILIEQSMLFPDTQNIDVAEPVILEKLGHVILSALSDPDIRDNISLIIVITRFPLNSGITSNKELRYQLQRRAELIRESLFSIEPQLEEKYGTYFAATAMAVDPTVKETNWIEFRIISTEMLHIEVLKRLEKYAH
ncbi:hypothetical protein NBG4_110025 [Candidatus Sulfobium mesophilum]|uniref:Uncharacterized protein n=1 Tax=Candidatus Sulfobium mesophilum TaxID=2016548 RepID=A0A2U3QE69_9BACT|nr:hypothetical protein NBG4_110025 [Candidatus Sulfobium mesophilum]